MCCHPTLSAASAIPLTLRAIGGLTTAEIARAFLVPEADDGPADQPGQAAHQVLSGAVPLPTSEEWGERLRSVLHVLYLMFNEGYASH